MSDQPTNPGQDQNAANTEAMLITGMGKVSSLQGQILAELEALNSRAVQNQQRDLALMSASQEALEHLDRLEALSKRCLGILQDFVRDIS
jgi:hypothetical protein